MHTPMPWLWLLSTCAASDTDAWGPSRNSVPFLLDYRTNQTIRYIHQNFVNWTHGGGLPATQTMQTNPCDLQIAALVLRLTWPSGVSANSPTNTASTHDIASNDPLILAQHEPPSPTVDLCSFEYSGHTMAVHKPNRPPLSLSS